MDLSGDTNSKYVTAATPNKHTAYGASAKTLHSVMDPQAYAAHNIDIDDPEWIDDHAQNEHGISKLVSYLEQPQLSLRIAIDTFREAFVGV